ncbi:MAG: diacylglycerol/lipid kinase family protein [Phycisphaerales bacterium]|jgi:diacylglycerol kinase (ATP)
MRVVCLFNPISGAGRARARAEAVGEAIRSSGHEAVLLETRRESAEDWLDPALPGASALVVCGGDGAVRLASRSASRAGVPIHQCPSGTENLFAKSFGMSPDPQGIARAVAAGRIRRIDTGTANGEPFLIMASVGFDAEVVHDLAIDRDGPISHRSYLKPILRQLKTWEPPRLKVAVDGDVIADIEAFAIVGNLKQYAGGLDPARFADPTDGVLDTLVFPTRNVGSLIRWAAEIATGLHVHDRRLRYRVGTVVEIESSTPIRMQLDGDAPGSVAASRHRFEIRPASLDVLLPA